MYKNKYIIFIYAMCVCICVWIRCPFSSLEDASLHFVINSIFYTILWVSCEFLRPGLGENSYFGLCVPYL